METALTRIRGAPVAELYSRHVPEAIRLARLLTGNDAVAEDVAHDAFIRAVGRFAHLRRPESFHAYLRTAVVNESRMRLRRARLERAWLDRQDGIEGSAWPPDIETRSEMWEALARLPWRQRAALVLRYYEDLSIKEVGDLLRCSSRAADALLSRGLAHLRGSLSKGER